uniref:Uncharacterized protein n=1 Tax=Oryza barthii TaxID=65489 RepID=A0A0D3FE57_9ORYZ
MCFLPWFVTVSSSCISTWLCCQLLMPSVRCRCQYWLDRMLGAILLPLLDSTRLFIQLDFVCSSSNCQTKLCVSNYRCEVSLYISFLTFLAVTSSELEYTPALTLSQNIINT